MTSHTDMQGDNVSGSEEYISMAMSDVKGIGNKILLILLMTTDQEFSIMINCIIQYCQY